jgi:hypothetical protein
MMLIFIVTEGDGIVVAMIRLQLTADDTVVAAAVTSAAAAAVVGVAQRRAAAGERRHGVVRHCSE